ncbi:MAG: DUF3999 domain-containing protein [Gammaproteobacteria bacterium]|nr:DUF3999 domain-containing protein [Gammaproteobacteria bacterium]
MKYYSLIIGLLMLNTIAQAASDIVSPEDLAWGITLNIKEDHAFYQLALPTPVYQGVTNSRLTDIRVFNGHNDIVPHDLLLPPKEQTTASRNRVKLYPLIGSNQRSIKSLSLQLTKKTPSGNWRVRSSGLIYTLSSEGAQLQNTNLPIKQVTDRYWKLATEEGKNGFGRSQPKIEFSWRPHNLRFSNRGEPPFTLAYGSRRLTDEFTNTDLIRGLSREQQNILISYQVAIGDVVTLGGTRALSGKIIADWKQWLLWGLLIAAALLLGWMAWSLMHRITT